jgi:hypothetical protein
MDTMDKSFVQQRAADLTHYINKGVLFDRNCADSDIWRKFVIPVSFILFSVF